MENKKRLQEKIEQKAKRLETAEEEKSTILSHTVFLGTLALLFIIPVIAGIYLGRWIDEQLAGYSYRWSISLLMTGIVLGCINVYFYIRKHE
jgi:ATP synthase protein I